MNVYRVKPLRQREIEVSVPASKSILSRALLLAAFTEGETVLSGCETFGQDGSDLLSCLSALGISAERTCGGLLVRGTKDFRREASLNVGSAGTAARFLTAILAFAGGNYRFDSSEQMKRRPMDLLFLLKELGATVRFLGEEGHFPFVLSSCKLSAREMTVDTDVSTQFASGLMLAAAVGSPLTLRLTGSRTHGSYLKTTEDVIASFGGKTVQSGNELTVFPIGRATARYAVPPDVSSGCYFYALSLLCGAKTLVRGVRKDCGQSDLRFLEVLRDKGVTLAESAEGIVADGRKVSAFSGFDLDMRDFSDQTMTLAALAPFADSPSVLRNIGHIRRQECDRVEAILHNLTALGVPCECRENDILIRPAPVRPAAIETYGDHRVAMAFSLVGLKVGGVTIENPDCCKKTFGNYFEILDEITRD